LTPILQRHATLLGSWIPFGKVGHILGELLGVHVSTATLRRGTEQHGAAYEATQTAAVTEIETQLPEPPAGPPKQLLSVDGAMVPLVGGTWVEVKTLVLGEISEPVLEGEEQVVRSRALSYFSRLADAETFQHLALVETHRRGVETAAQVIAPTDGAVWIQGFLDYHRHDAQRILDFGHAAAYVAVIGSAVGTPESVGFTTWLNASLHTLKHTGATALLPELRTQVARYPERTELAEALAYLETRTAMMDYPAYQQQGWPIGSGSVESGNKVVVEARLKGAGMHWARPHVNPMLSLRNAVCSERWDEAWLAITTQHRQLRRQRFLSRARRNTLVPLPPPLLSPAPSQLATVGDAPATEHKKRWRPAADHPWRRSLGPLPSRRSRPAEI
jgi:hypothetical protein